MQRLFLVAHDRLGRAFVSFEEKPLVVVAVAAGASVATAVLLAASAGWPKVLRLVFARHAWIWLAVFNNTRLHESLGDIPPAEYEQQHADGEPITLAGATV